MAQCKASQVDGFIAKPQTSCHLILLYGPDEGLVSEHADNLAISLKIDTSNPMTVFRFNIDDVATDPGKLADEAFAISMFGGNKFIRIKGQTRKNILPALKPVLDHPPPECWIVIESGNLKRDSALRKAVEKSPNAMALPCYQDGATALAKLVHEEITANGLSMDSDTTDYLRSMLGEDRRASRNELKKLALFAHGQETITRDQITLLLGNVSSIDNDEIIDAASLGHTEFLEAKFNHLMSSGAKADMLMWAGLRQFQMLHEMRATMDKFNKSPATLIASARPPIHFSRRDLIMQSLKYWTLEKIEQALKRLNTAFYEARAKPALAQSIAATTLLAIAIQARRR